MPSNCVQILTERIKPIISEANFEDSEDYATPRQSASNHLRSPYLLLYPKFYVQQCIGFPEKTYDIERPKRILPPVLQPMCSRNTMARMQSNGFVAYGYRIDRECVGSSRDRVHVCGRIGKILQNSQRKAKHFQEHCWMLYSILLLFKSLT